LDGLRELVSADMRVRVADRFAGRFADAPYVARYDRGSTPWRLRVAVVDGVPMIVAEYLERGVWMARGLIRLQVQGSRVAEIADYTHCPWVLGAAEDVSINA
jgi:RNA polymerase sigma-70 factor (ECF subfamily)